VTVIRAATHADIPAIVALGRAFLETSPYQAWLEENPDQLAAMTTVLLESPAGHVVVADVGEAVVGFLALVVVPHDLSAALTAKEVCWYVRPETRGVGLRLLRAAERWARAQGARTVQMIAPRKAPRVEALYVALGYEPVEVVFQRTL